MTDETANIAFIRGAMVERLSPPGSTVGFVGWVRSNLFSSIPNTLLTLFSLYLVWVIVPPLIRFLFIDAVWDGASRADCLEETVKRPVGACWPFIKAKFGQLVYGFYPLDPEEERDDREDGEEHYRVLALGRRGRGHEPQQQGGAQGEGDIYPPAVVEQGGTVDDVAE